MSQPKGVFSVTEEFVRELLTVAIKHRKQVKIAYVDKKGNHENRIFEPFEFDQTGRNVGGWCHLRDQYRNFSFDRIARIVLTDYTHTKEPLEKA